MTTSYSFLLVHKTRPLLKCVWNREKISPIFEILAQHDYLVFQSNRNLPPVFQKSQLNLLYEPNQKANFILQKFQTPATLSLSSISENCKKPNAFLSLRRQALPLCYLSPSLRCRQRHCSTSLFSAFDSVSISVSEARLLQFRRCPHLFWKPPKGTLSRERDVFQF